MSNFSSLVGGCRTHIVNKNLQWSKMYLHARFGSSAPHPPTVGGVHRQTEKLCIKVLKIWEDFLHIHFVDICLCKIVQCNEHLDQKAIHSLCIVCVSAGGQHHPVGSSCHFSSPVSQITWSEFADAIDTLMVGIRTRCSLISLEGQSRVQWGWLQKWREGWPKKGGWWWLVFPSLCSHSWPSFAIQLFFLWGVYLLLFFLRYNKSFHWHNYLFHK